MLQDRKVAHCPFHMLMPAEREMFLARKRLLEYMGFQLRHAVSAKESQWDPKLLNLSKKGGCQRPGRMDQRHPRPGSCCSSQLHRVGFPPPGGASGVWAASGGCRGGAGWVRVCFPAPAQLALVCCPPRSSCRRH